MTAADYVEENWVAKNLEELVTYYKKVNFVNTGITTLRELIKTHLKSERQAMAGATKAEGKEMTYDDGIDSIFLKEAREYINKSIYCFFAYKHLQMGGYLARSMDAFYYSRFYLDNYLCRLQGEAIIHHRPLLQISRVDWDKKKLLIRKCPGNDGIHIKNWELTKSIYQYFKPDKPLSANKSLIGAYFQDDWWKKVGLTIPEHEDYNKRIEHTYDLFGFDELYYAPDYNFPIRHTKKDGKINYIDNKVFLEISNEENFDGSGVEENGFGNLLNLAIELAGYINEAISDKVIVIYVHNLELLKTNEKSKQSIFDWIKAANIEQFPL